MIRGVRLPPLFLPAGLSAVVALAALRAGGEGPAGMVLRLAAVALLLLAAGLLVGELLLRRRVRALLRAAERAAGQVAVARAGLEAAAAAPAPPAAVPPALADAAGVAASLARVTAGLEARLAVAEAAASETASEAAAAAARGTGAGEAARGPGAERLRDARQLAAAAADELDALLDTVHGYLRLARDGEAAAHAAPADVAALEAGAARGAALARRLRAFGAGAPPDAGMPADARMPPGAAR